jgi:hypothetical protein
MSKPVKITGLNPGWNFHIHAAELDAETVVDENGEVSFSVANGFNAIMPGKNPTLRTLTSHQVKAALRFLCVSRAMT